VPDSLSFLWGRVDCPDPIYTADEVVAWPPDALDQLLAVGLVKPVANAGSVLCDACGEGHVEEVLYVDSPPGSPLRAYIACPDAGRVRVPLGRLRRWAADPDALAAALAGALGTSGRVETVTAGRLWVLGRSTLAGQPRRIVLARGLGWGDHQQVTGYMTCSPDTLVLVPNRVPAREVWQEAAPPVVGLPDVATLAGGRLAIDRAALEAVLPRPGRTKPRQPSRSFPTPDGATWEDVSLRVTDHELHVEVRGTGRTFSFKDAGFEEGRRGNVPDQLWHLLHVFARLGGEVPFDSPQLEQKDRINLRQKVSKLGQRLKALLHIEERPFEDVGKTRRYKTRFRIRSGEPTRLSTPAGCTWEQVTITEAGPDAIRVTVDTTESFAAWAADEDAPTGRWEGAQQTGTRSRIYNLSELGLVSASGQPKPIGKALLAVLAAGGRVQRPANDESMLRLGKFLSRLLQIENSPPFQFIQGEQEWVAIFEAAREPAAASR
jgi:hypothetical protein